MVNSKNRVTSVLLVLCMVMVMLAGILIVAPVQVKAARISGVSLSSGVSINVYPTTLARVGFSGSGTITIYDDKGSSWQYSSPVAKSASSSGGTSISSGLFTPAFVYDNNADYYVVISAGTLFESDISGATSGTPMDEITFGTRPAWLDPQPTPAPDAGTGEYYDRHYSFWNGVHAQLSALPNNGRVTVDTEGHNLDMVMHFTFDALNNTNRTLIIKHQGSTYTIRGKAESADHVWMGGILLGNNHSFSILGAYRK